MSNIEHITSLTCISASGKVLPNFLIYAKSLPTLTIDEELPHGWHFGVSQTGI